MTVPQRPSGVGGDVEPQEPQDSPDPGGSLPSQVQPEITRLVRQEVREIVHQGPLPPAETLEGYNRVVPGSAKLTFDQFVAQSQHRRAMEKAIVEGSERRADLGQWLGFAFLLICALAGVYVVLTGEAVAGAAITTGALASGAVVYVVGGRPPTEQRNKDRPNEPPSEG